MEMYDVYLRIRVLSINDILIDKSQIHIKNTKICEEN